MQPARKAEIFFGGGLGKNRIGEKALLITRPDLIGRRSRSPGRVDFGRTQQHAGLAAPVIRHDQCAQAFFAGASRAA